MTKASDYWFLLLIAALLAILPAEALGNPFKSFALGKTAEIHALAFSPDGKTLAVSAAFATPNGHVDPVVVLWNLDSDKRLDLRQRVVSDLDTARNIGPYVVRRLEFSPNGQYLVATDLHGYVLWNRAGEEKRRWLSWISSELSPGWSSDSTLLALPAMEQERFSATNGIAVVDVASGARLIFFPVEYGYARTARFSPNDKLLATAGHDCHVRVFDIQRRTNVFTDHVQNTLFALAFSPDGGSLLAGPSTAGVMLRYDVTLQTSAVRKAGVTEGRLGESIYRIDFHPDGTMALTSGLSGLSFWDPATWTSTPSLRNCQGRLSSDGRFIAVAKEGNPGEVELWKTADLKALDARSIQGELHEVDFKAPTEHVDVRRL